MSVMDIVLYKIYISNIIRHVNCNFRGGLDKFTKSKQMLYLALVQLLTSVKLH